MGTSERGEVSRFGFLAASDHYSPISGSSGNFCHRLVNLPVKEWVVPLICARPMLAFERLQHVRHSYNNYKLQHFAVVGPPSKFRSRLTNHALRACRREETRCTTLWLPLRAAALFSFPVLVPTDVGTVLRHSCTQSTVPGTWDNSRVSRT